MRSENRRVLKKTNENAHQTPNVCIWSNFIAFVVVFELGPLQTIHPPRSQEMRSPITALCLLKISS